MSVSYKYCLSAIARDVEGDVRLNGMSVLSCTSTERLVRGLTCHAYLVKGWNRFEVWSAASREGIDPERVFEATLSRPFAWENPDDQDTVVRYVHADHAAAHGLERFTAVQTHEFHVKEDLGRWAFIEARPLDDKERSSIELAMSPILTVLRNRDLKGLLELRSLVTTEEALGMDAPRSEVEDELSEHWTSLMSEPDFAVAPVSLGALALEFRLGGRVVVARDDRSKAFARGTAGGKPWSLHLAFAFVDGSIRWVR